MGRGVIDCLYEICRRSIASKLVGYKPLQAVAVIEGAMVAASQQLILDGLVADRGDAVVQIHRSVSEPRYFGAQLRSHDGRQLCGGAEGERSANNRAGSYLDVLCWRLCERLTLSHCAGGARPSSIAGSLGSLSICIEPLFQLVGETCLHAIMP